MTPVLWYGTQLKKSPAAAAAKSLQSCPILCDPIDGSPPGSPVPGILQARTLEYYSAIKKNTFESILMRWMNLEPIIQSEVTQKEKDKYHILTHIQNLEKWY